MILSNWISLDTVIIFVKEKWSLVSLFFFKFFLVLKAHEGTDIARFFLITEDLAQVGT